MKKIPIDNVVSCAFHKRAPGAFQMAFWQTLHEKLDEEQSRLLQGMRITLKEIVSDFKFARPKTVNKTEGPILLPPVKIHAKADASGVVDPDKVEYYQEFTLRVKTGWQRDVILDVLRRFAGRYFRFDFGGEGAEKRRLPTGRHLATKGRELPTIV